VLMVGDEAGRARLDREVAERDARDHEVARLVGLRFRDLLAGRVVNDDGRANERVEQGVLECPCHQGSFDLASGRPTAGPPRRPLDLVRLEIMNRQVYATGIEARTS